MIQVRLVGADGTPVTVLPSGQLAVAPRRYSDPISIKLDVANQAYNFFSAVPGRKYVITEIVLTADKGVTTDALIEIFEASAADSAVVAKMIFKTEMLKNTVLALIGLNWEVNAGTYLNAKTDDDDVYATISAFYIDDDGSTDVGLGTGEDA